MFSTKEILLVSSATNIFGLAGTVGSRATKTAKRVELFYPSEPLFANS